MNWHLPMHKVLGGLGGERVQAAGFAVYCNYFSKRKKDYTYKLIVVNSVFFFNICNILILFFEKCV